MTKKESIAVTHNNKLKHGDCNLFFVSTALHLLNSIEAQHHFKTQNNIIVLLSYGNNLSDDEQLKQLLEEFPYDTLITFNIGKAKLYHKLNRLIIKEINKYNYEHVFVGYFSANLRRFLCNIPCEKLFLLDDGTYLIALHNELYNPSFDASKYLQLIRGYSEKPRKNKFKQLIFLTYDLYRRIYFKAHGHKNDFKKIKLNFFTIFNIPQYENEIIVKHSFTRLREKYALSRTTKQSSNIVYFLGQPLDKAIGMTEKKYVEMITKIHLIYAEKKIKLIYIPHRSEQKHIKLEKLEKKSSTFETLNIKAPFEIHALNENLEINHIASFFSSALFTTKKLFPNVKVDAYKPQFNFDKRNDIKIIYDTMRREQMEVFYID